MFATCDPFLFFDISHLQNHISNNMRLQLPPTPPPTPPTLAVAAVRASLLDQSWESCVVHKPPQRTKQQKLLLPEQILK